jgi:hypothetical protein
MNSLIMRKSMRDEIVASLKATLRYVTHVPLKYNINNMVYKLSNLTEIKGEENEEDTVSTVASFDVSDTSTKRKR